MRQLRIFLLSIVATLLVCNSAHALKSDWFNADWSFSGKKKSVCYNATDPASPAVLAYSPASLAFGNATTSSTHTLTTTLSNTGGSTATGLAQSGLSTPFSIASTTCGSTLEASGSCTTTVQYAPTDTVASSGTLTASATGITAATAEVSGTGVVITCTPIALISQNTSTRSYTNTITFGQSFTPTSNMSITSITVYGATGTAGIMNMRVGVGTNLSTAYLSEKTNISMVVGVNTITLDTPITLNSGTVYSFIFNKLSGNINLNWSTADPYSGGAVYYSGTVTYSPGVYVGRDLQFEISGCNQ